MAFIDYSSTDISAVFVISSSLINSSTTFTSTLIDGSPCSLHSSKFSSITVNATALRILIETKISAVFLALQTVSLLQFQLFQQFHFNFPVFALGLKLDLEARENLHHRNLQQPGSRAF